MQWSEALACGSAGGTLLAPGVTGRQVAVGGDHAHAATERLPLRGAALGREPGLHGGGRRDDRDRRCCGARAGLAVSRILPSVLFGVSSADVFALVATLLVVGGVALTAGFLPARRASRVDPNTVLHYE